MLRQCDLLPCIHKRKRAQNVLNGAWSLIRKAFCFLYSLRRRIRHVSTGNAQTFPTVINVRFSIRKEIQVTNLNCNSYLVSIMRFSPYLHNLNCTKPSHSLFCKRKTKIVPNITPTTFRSKLFNVFRNEKKMRQRCKLFDAKCMKKRRRRRGIL